MSVGAEIWRHIVAKPESPFTVEHRPDTAVLHSVGDPALSLIHQLFLTGEQQRKSVLFVSISREHAPTVLCQQIGTALSRITGQKVAIVDSEMENAKPAKKPSMSFGQPFWQTRMVPVAERVHRICSEVLCADYRPTENFGSSWEEIRGAFEYFLFSASMNDGTLPLLGNLCDAAVLVVSANATRREAALRAKEQLIRQRVNLLGTVLDERTLPIPEFLYRRI
jgi:hypothetical protein